MKNKADPGRGASRGPEQARAPPVQHRNGGGKPRGGGARAKCSNTAVVGVLAGNPRRDSWHATSSQSNVSKASAAANAGTPDPTGVTGRQDKTLATSVTVCPTVAAASQPQTGPEQKLGEQTEGPKPKKASLQERAERFLRRKVSWLPRTPENHAALVRSLRLYVEGCDPDCLEDTSWMSSLLEKVWIDIGEELELGRARSCFFAREAERHSTYATGLPVHQWWSPYRWLPRRGGRVMDTLRDPVALTLSGVGTTAVLGGFYWGAWKLLAGFVVCLSGLASGYLVFGHLPVVQQTGTRLWRWLRGLF